MKRTLFSVATLIAAGLPGTGLAQADAAREIATSICIACHGEDGNSVVPNFPKLAGQHAVYLEKQLKEFLSGKRQNEAMAPFLNAFSADEVPALAAYYAALPAAPGTVEDPALAEAGRQLYEDGNTDSGIPACQGCHQPQGVGNTRYPRLAGQHQAYTLQQMQDFKSGVRSNDRGKIMRAVAERMTEEEMKAVSEYLAGM